MKKSIFMLALALAVTANLQGTSFAQEKIGMQEHSFNGQHGQMPPQHHGDGLGKQLNLTQEQAARAKEISEASRARIKPIMGQVRAEKEKFRQMRQSNASQEELQAQKQKLLGLMRQARQIREQNFNNFKQILTPEQKTQFDEIKKQRMERMRQKRMERMNQKGQRNDNEFNNR